MAGRMRGRGRGRPNSFIEQLGFHKGESLPTSTMQPLPSYLPLNNKPMPIELTTEMNYLVELKRDFAEYMQESSNNIQVVVLKEDIKRFCEDYDMSIAECNKLECDWSRIPSELKSLETSKSRKRKQKNDVDVTRKLMKLEKKESKENEEEEEEEIKEEDDEEDAEEKEMNERMKEEDLIDQEMDAGTDYNFEYFENGEKDLSDDDDKDGPTY